MAEARDTAGHALRHFFEAGDVSGVILVVDDLAVIAVADRDLIRGGRLWGAARALQQTTGTAIADYVDQNFDLFHVPTPRHVLSADELALRSAEGAAMGLDELVAYALDGGDADARDVPDTPDAPDAADAPDAHRAVDL